MIKVYDRAVVVPPLRNRLVKYFKKQDTVSYCTVPLAVFPTEVWCQ